MNLTKRLILVEFCFSQIANCLLLGFKTQQ